MDCAFIFTKTHKGSAIFLNKQSKLQKIYFCNQKPFFLFLHIEYLPYLCAKITKYPHYDNILP